MPVSLTVNGVPFNYPAVVSPPDKKWGAAATGWAQAVTAAISHLRGPNLPIATDGQIRLGNLDSIQWRNFADGDNISLFVNASDRLIYDDGITQKDLSLTGGGNVQHLSPSVDNTLPRFDGVSGAVLQTSDVVVDDSDNMTVPGSVVTPLVDTEAITLGAGDIDLEKALVPLGAVIWHYDFAGAFVPDSAYWKPCDGGTYTIGGSARTTPDLSGRYIVGFGTDGGGDIDSAVWATGAVGNAAHQIALNHTHDVNISSFSTNTTGNHSHTVNSHNHSAGDLVAEFFFDTGAGEAYADFTTADSWASDRQMGSISDNGAGGGNFTAGLDVQGATGSATPGTSIDGDHSHTVNPPNTTSTSALSATQNIQPRSIRMRAYIRAK